MKLFACFVLVSFSLSITQIVSAQDDSWTAFSQKIDATPYKGKKFKFSGAVRNPSTGMAMLWARVDKSDKSPAFFDNMQDRPVQDAKWQVYVIEGEIDKDAVQLLVGGLCVNDGNYFFDDFSVQIETVAGEWEAIPLKNIDFETATLSTNIPTGWESLKNNEKFQYSFSGTEAYKGTYSLQVKTKEFSIASADAPVSLPKFIRDSYTKYEYQIPVRDGIKLFTSVYVPKDASETNLYPIMMQRTCYSVAPYGTDKYNVFGLGPSETMVREKYVFVHQDVRGRWMSEGTWTNMTPHLVNKNSKSDVDESSDAWDTIDWLLKNVKFNNGKVGQWGISYPGFYTSASSINAHPALKAASPQAPVADFFFDDFHHNGAFTQGYFWNFPIFGEPRPAPTNKDWYTLFNKPTPDGYEFYMRMGTLKDGGDKYYKNNFLWKEVTEHPNYDDFWKKRRIVNYLRNLKPAYLVVGGWFDAEDLYGALVTYKEIEKNNPNIYNTIVMGPFGHGDWAWEQGHHKHHQIYFGDSIASFYQKNIEAKFFHHFLKGPADNNTGLAEAYMFNTGKKEWQTFEQWPPKAAEKQKMYLSENGKLSFEAPKNNSYSQYTSNPAKPVPYTMDIAGSFDITPRNYMSEDQRFAGRRPDVLVFETEELNQDITLGGEISVNLKVSTTGTDADWVVKLIDVYPGMEPNGPYTPQGVVLSGYQQMVRSEAMRSRFRNSFEKPEPMVANKITPINFRLQDVLHTFKKGHRIMIQVQSTWFPLIDRNPQKFVSNIYKADRKDFITATHRVYHSTLQPSFIEVEVLKP